MAASAALADGTHALNQDAAILSGADSDKVASLDILTADTHRDGNNVTFHLTTNGTAGADPSVAVGRMTGVPATMYVWPTSLDPSTVGFEGATGILSLAATTLPNFDDTRCLTKCRWQCG